MRPDILPKLDAATQALYLREHAKVRDILEEESRIRAGLAKLDLQLQTARDTAQDDPSLRALGADVLWRAWEEKTRRALNMELAQVMARKLQVMDQVKLAFGKKVAVQELAKLDKRDRHARKEKLREARLLGQ